MNLIIAHISERDSQRIEATLLMLGLGFVIVVAVVIFVIVNIAQLRKVRSERRNQEADQSSKGPDDNERPC